eukprot:TRINITY_DN8224_c0_g1_i1.p6 TRINITY_DN8224_c0_g1~~TRINITY_DN8224_c0_g1_i1.p6  ORF type:complete len:129 (+),score=10.02 TRINITY_DN8224_c0_g1_i1:586-972(+)
MNAMKVKIFQTQTFLNITMWAGVPSEPLCLHTQSLATAQKLQNQPTHLIIAQTNFRVSKTNLKFTPKHKKSKKKKLHKNLPKFFPKLRQSNYYNKNVPKQCMQTEDTPEKKTITLKTLKRSLFSRQTK